MLIVAILAAVQAMAVPPAGEADIVVVARRFDETHGKLTRSPFSKTISCSVSQSSGDKAIDDAVCQIAVTCVRTHKKRPAFLDCVAAGRQSFLDSYQFAERDDDHAAR